MLASTVHHIQLQMLVCRSSCFVLTCAMHFALSELPALSLCLPGACSIIFRKLLYAFLDTPSQQRVTPVHKILDSSLTSLFPLGDNLGLRLSSQLSPFPFCLCPYDMSILPLAGSLFTTRFLGLSHLVPALFLEILYSYRQMLFKRSPFPPVRSLVWSRSLCCLSLLHLLESELTMASYISSSHLPSLIPLPPQAQRFHYSIMTYWSYCKGLSLYYTLYII